MSKSINFRSHYYNTLNIVPGTEIESEISLLSNYLFNYSNISSDSTVLDKIRVRFSLKYLYNTNDINRYNYYRFIVYKLFLKVIPVSITYSNSNNTTPTNNNIPLTIRDNNIQSTPTNNNSWEYYSNHLYEQYNLLLSLTPLLVTHNNDIINCYKILNILNSNDLLYIDTSNTGIPDIVLYEALTYFESLFSDSNNDNRNAEIFWVFYNFIEKIRKQCKSFKNELNSTTDNICSSYFTLLVSNILQKIDVELCSYLTSNTIDSISLLLYIANTFFNNFGKKYLDHIEILFDRMIIFDIDYICYFFVSTLLHIKKQLFLCIDNEQNTSNNNLITFLDDISNNKINCEVLLRRAQEISEMNFD